MSDKAKQQLAEWLTGEEGCLVLHIAEHDEYRSDYQFTAFRISDADLQPEGVLDLRWIHTADVSAVYAETVKTVILGKRLLVFKKTPFLKAFAELFPDLPMPQVEEFLPVIGQLTLDSELRQMYREQVSYSGLLSRAVMLGQGGAGFFRKRMGPSQDGMALARLLLRVARQSEAIDTPYRIDPMLSLLYSSDPEPLYRTDVFTLQDVIELVLPKLPTPTGEAQDPIHVWQIDGYYREGIFLRFREPAGDSRFLRPFQLHWSVGMGYLQLHWLNAEYREEVFKPLITLLDREIPRLRYR